MKSQVNSSEFQDIISYSPPKYLVSFVVCFSIIIFSFIFVLFFYNINDTHCYELNKLTLIDPKGKKIEGYINTEKTSLLFKNQTVKLLFCDKSVSAIIIELSQDFNQNIVVKIQLPPNFKIEELVENKSCVIQAKYTIPLYKDILFSN